MATWLLLDVSYLMHRAFYVMGDMSHDGAKTGALYGFFRDLLDLVDLLGAERIVFAFDAGYAYRREIFPGYKVKETLLSPEEVNCKAELNRQIGFLRDKYLHQIGYRNILHQNGFEADDMIASATAHLPAGVEAVIVSADQDLWQLVSDRVWCYNPTSKKAVTQKSFRRDWGIDPIMWASVKALAGCLSDKIPGIVGIGEKSAAKWFAGTLKPGVKRTAIEQNIEVYNRNIKLTRLPAPGTTPQNTWLDDCVTQEKWEGVAAQLGFRGIRMPLTR